MSTEMKAQLLSELPYHRIEQPRKPNKYLDFFGSYIALPLMTIILVLSLLILFLLVKTYFSNSYMYALKESMDNKKANELDIGAIVDTRYDQFNNNRKQSSNNNNNNNNNNLNNNNFVKDKVNSNTINRSSPSLLEKMVKNSQ